MAGPGIYDKLLGGLVPAVKSLVVGDPLSEDTEMGSLVHADQLDRVAGSSRPR